MSRSHPAGPWRTTDHVRLGLGLGAGALAWLAASVGSERVTETDDQMIFGVLGVLAVAVLAVSVLGWLTVARRLVGLRMDVLLGQGAEPEERRRLPSATLVAVPGLTRYHRADCAMVQGKPTAARSRHDHETAGLTGCRMCGTLDA